MQTTSYSRAMLALRAFSYPTVIIVLTLILPGLHEIFSVTSAHASFAWLLIFFCWPWMACVVLINILRHRRDGTMANLLFGLGILLFYSVGTVLLALGVSHGLGGVWKQPIPAFTFWWALNFPLSLLFSFAA
jgi:hypothetical protein